MSQAKIVFQNICCIPITKNILMRIWLSWINNPVASKQINKERKRYTQSDLDNYLNTIQSI